MTFGRDMPGAWVACKQVTFDGRECYPGEVILPAGVDWPCDMMGLAKAGLAMHVPDGYQMWRPDISASWRLRELGTAAPVAPESPPPAAQAIKPEPPPAPVAQPVAQVLPKSQKRN